MVCALLAVIIETQILDRWTLCEDCPNSAIESAERSACVYAAKHGPISESKYFPGGTLALVARAHNVELRFL